MHAHGGQQGQVFVGYVYKQWMHVWWYLVRDAVSTFLACGEDDDPDDPEACIKPHKVHKVHKVQCLCADSCKRKVVVLLALSSAPL